MATTFTGNKPLPRRTRPIGCCSCLFVGRRQRRKLPQRRVQNRNSTNGVARTQSTSSEESVDDDDVMTALPASLPSEAPMPPVESALRLPPPRLHGRSFSLPRPSSKPSAQTSSGFGSLLYAVPPTPIGGGNRSTPGGHGIPSGNGCMPTTTASTWNSSTSRQRSPCCVIVSNRVKREGSETVRDVNEPNPNYSLPRCICSTCISSRRSNIERDQHIYRQPRPLDLNENTYYNVISGDLNDALAALEAEIGSIRNHSAAAAAVAVKRDHLSTHYSDSMSMADRRQGTDGYDTVPTPLPVWNYYVQQQQQQPSRSSVYDRPVDQDRVDFGAVYCNEEQVFRSRQIYSHESAGSVGAGEGFQSDIRGTKGGDVITALTAKIIDETSNRQSGSTESSSQEGTFIDGCESRQAGGLALADDVCPVATSTSPNLTSVANLTLEGLHQFFVDKKQSVDIISADVHCCSAILKESNGESFRETEKKSSDIDISIELDDTSATIGCKQHHEQSQQTDDKNFLHSSGPSISGCYDVTNTCASTTGTSSIAESTVRLVSDVAMENTKQRPPLPKNKRLSVNGGSSTKSRDVETEITLKDAQLLRMSPPPPVSPTSPTFPLPKIPSEIRRQQAIDDYWTRSAATLVDARWRHNAGDNFRFKSATIATTWPSDAVDRMSLMARRNGQRMQQRQRRRSEGGGRLRSAVAFDTIFENVLSRHNSDRVKMTLSTSSLNAYLS